MNSLKPLVEFAGTKLFLTFYELRSLVKFKRKRDSTDAADWHYVNSFLAAAAAERAKRQNIPPPTFAPTDPSDFAANLEQAVGKVSYTLPLVKNVDDLYDQRTRSDVVDFIKKNLYMEIGDFTEMMKRKQLIENEWDAINGLLESAGRSKRLNDPHYQLDVKKRDDFATNLDNAIGKPDFQSVECADIEGYADAIAFLEEYFSMTADHFRDLIGVVAQRNWKNDTTHKDWDRVYAYLADAHKHKVYDERRRALQAAREAKDKKDGKGGSKPCFTPRSARPATAAPSPLDRLKDILKADDYVFLQEVAARKSADVTPDEWNRAYRVVEVAARLKSGMAEPVALKEEWLNVYPIEDATTARVVAGPEAGALPRWKTFGRAAAVGKDDPPPPPVLGWAIRSPLLELGQGKRTITLTLGFAVNSLDVKVVGAVLASGEAPFQFQVSTEKGWGGPQPPVAGILDDYQKLTGVAGTLAAPLSAIQFQLAFGADVDPIAPPKPAEGETASPWPILRLMLRSAWREDVQQYVAPYAAFRNLVLERVHLRVEVGDDERGEGLTDFQAQNDESVIDPRKPFQPFGSSPSVGSRFLLGHPSSSASGSTR